ncbi:MAG: transposase, partial [Methanobacteriota archaeon]
VWERVFAGIQDAGLPPEPVRRRLGLSKATFYRKLKEHRAGGVAGRRTGSGRPRLFRPKDLKPLVKASLRDLPPVAGHRRVWRGLAKQGVLVSKSTAYRVVRDLRLLVPPRRGRIRKKVEPIRVEGPDQAWVIDTTEWWIGNQKYFAYLAIDAHSRYCPALTASMFEDSASTLRFYETALRDHVPAAVHTDRGGEFANHDCQTYLSERKVQWNPGPSYSPNAQAFVERFVLTLKEEWLMWKDPQTYKEFQECLDAFRDWYNRTREHSSLDYAVPEAIHHA